MAEDRVTISADAAVQLWEIEQDNLGRLSSRFGLRVKNSTPTKIVLGDIYNIARYLILADVALKQESFLHQALQKVLFLYPGAAFQEASQ